MSNGKVREKESADWITPVAIFGGLGMLVWGAYSFFGKETEGEPYSLKIDYYTNLDTGESVEAPGVLDVRNGERVEVFFSYIYKGPAIDGKYHGAFAQNHDELSSVEVPFSIPEADSDTEQMGSIILTNENMSPQLYGLYIKIMSIPGSDIHYWLQNVINVPGSGFEIEEPSVSNYSNNDGDTVSITVPVTNNDDTQRTINVAITIYQGALIGSGQIVPDGQQDMDLVVGAGATINAVFQHTCTDLGGDATRDIDIDVTEGGAQLDHIERDDLFRVEGEEQEKLIISITPIGAGHVIANPEPIHIDGDDWWYEKGAVVQLTAVPNSGWVFEKWSSEVPGGVSYDNPVTLEPMTETRDVLCHFEEPSAVGEFRNVRVEAFTTPLAEGDQGMVSCSFEYQGPEIWEELTIEIGHVQWPNNFVEKIRASQVNPIPATPSWTRRYGVVPFTVPGPDVINPAESPFDVWCYIGGEYSDKVTDQFYVSSGPVVTPALEAEYSPSDGFILYSFVGFHPNSLVTVSILETGATVSSYSDNNGAGSGLIYLGFEGGNYTLRAVDSQGASDQTIITVTISLYRLGIEIINPDSVLTGATHWWAEYFDPVTGQFVQETVPQWHGVEYSIGFPEAHGGGYFALFLYNINNGQMSVQVNTPNVYPDERWTSWRYDFASGLIYKT